MSMTPFEKKIQVQSLSTGLPTAIVNEHLNRLDSDYFNEFTPEEIILHLRKISEIGIQREFSFELLSMDATHCGLTVIGQDLPGFFAALTGLVASYDFDIQAGKVFSYSVDATQIGDDGRSRALRGKLIDFLVLEHPQPGFLTESFKNALIADLEHLVGLLHSQHTQELRKDLYRRIGEYLSRNASDMETTRLPLEIQVDCDDRHTILTINGANRKALLFSLSNALMLQGVSIQKLLTLSEGDHFEDRIFITDLQGKPITDIRTLERLKVAIVLMERFTSTLPQATDYPAAVQSFNEFIDSLMDKSDGNPKLPEFEDFSILASLAKILGAGPYLWEELIKTPLADLTGLLQGLEEAKIPISRKDLGKLLQRELAKVETYSEKAQCLNRFKDFQLFRLDVVYLVYPNKTLQEFSGELSDLADAILEGALWTAYDRLSSQFGEPQAVSGAGKSATPCHFGLFAQGKLGGRELGYASDLELQLLYGNAGETQGTGKPISHGEFFSLLVQEIRTLIIAKKEGIFELDLRLRPHGDSGPLATTVDVWVEYYGEDGGALDFERQALLKLRPIAATPGFAERVMTARDALVFGENAIGTKKSLELRDRQIEMKTAGHGAQAINAKYSAGGLVEVEYAVQFLQLQYGRKLASLREPNTEKAMEILLSEGILSPGEFETLYKGYVLLRRVINALRMVRGHSRDLFVPARGTTEFLHLAKRMGYLPTANFPIESQLDWDLQRTLKEVHAAFQRHYQSPIGSKPEPPVRSNAQPEPADPVKWLEGAMARLGLEDMAGVSLLIQNLFASVHEKGLLSAALMVSEPKLRSSPDPVSVIRHLTQFLEAVPDPDHFVRQMLNHPHLVEILIKAFGHSEYLTQILLQQPGYLLDLGNPRALEKAKLFSEFQREIQAQLPKASGLPAAEESHFTAALESLRRYRNREYLRIGLRDIFLGEGLQRITAEISHLSNALIGAAFELTMAKAETLELREAITVIALGKLGGNELNYSSDIDIVFVFDPAKANDEAQIALVNWARLFIASLSEPGTQGKLFRVDTQLRPYGGQSSLIGSTEHYRTYYQDAAAGWELQSWLKARHLTGSPGIAAGVIEGIQALAVSPRNRGKVETSMRQVRNLGLEKLRQEDKLSTEVKLGPGGIRTIEFYVQYQQILYGEALPELIYGNTLSVLGRLFRYRLISHNYYDLLSKSYIFLRRIEHVLQLQGLQQRHVLPDSPVEMEKLAKRMGFEERAGQGALTQFRSRYRQYMLTLLELSSSLFGYETNIPGDSQETR